MVVERHGLLTGAMGGVIVCQALAQIRLAFGVGKRPGCLVFLVNGGIGSALQLMQHLVEVAHLVEIIGDPQGHVTGRLVPGDESRAPI